jgi:hypothetical protein
MSLFLFKIITNYFFNQIIKGEDRNAILWKHIDIVPDIYLNFK